MISPRPSSARASPPASGGAMSDRLTGAGEAGAGNIVACGQLARANDQARGQPAKLRHVGALDISQAKSREARIPSLIIARRRRRRRLPSRLKWARQRNRRPLRADIDSPRVAHSSCLHIAGLFAAYRRSACVDRAAGPDDGQRRRRRGETRASQRPRANIGRAALSRASIWRGRARERRADSRLGRRRERQ